jgi:glutamate formiminotransferase/formiminotetrahydrofolate cyclodeaminase
MSVRDFVHETAADSPAPGGGSVAALLGSLGAALGTMVANLSAHKRGWDARWEEFSEWAERGKACHAELLALVDADTRAFDALLAAFGLSKASEAEKAAREAAIQQATRGAIEVPLRVMQVALSSMQVLRAMVESGLQSSVSDAGVGALAARSAVLGAHLNVKTNATGLKDRAAREDYLARGAALAAQAVEQERAILAAVESRLADKG